MPTTAVSIDRQDVAVVENLEPKVRDLIEALREALPAARRLEDSRYVGAEGVVWDLVCGIDTGGADGSPQCLLEALEDFRIAAGDQAALDYHRLCVATGLTVAKAAKQILEEGADDEHLARVEDLRKYAATR